MRVVEKYQNILEKFSSHVLMSRDVYSGTAGESGECGGEELEEVHSCFFHLFCACHCTVTWVYIQEQLQSEVEKRT